MKCGYCREPAEKRSCSFGYSGSGVDVVSDTQHPLEDETVGDTSSTPVHLGIVSTTIYDESGFLPLDRLAAGDERFSVTFYIAADQSTPGFDVSRFSCPVHFLEPAWQERFRCSPEIGWASIQRRNLALLRCIQDDPDCALLMDDDNVPPPRYLDEWYRVLTTAPARSARPKQTTSQEPPWHNYLRTADSPVEIHPRGFPPERRGVDATEIVDLHEGAVAAEDVWIYQGISLGEPDVDAATRIAVSPRTTTVDELDYVLRDVWSPYNSQNTVLHRELLPLACVWPHCGRYDDVFASFSWQAFAFSKQKYGHVGNSVNTQGERRRDPLLDLADEIEGMGACAAVAEALASISAETPLAFLEAMMDLPAPEPIARHRRFFEAFRRDLETVLA